MKTPDNGTILAVWHMQSIADVENRLTVPDGGLTDEEAAVRLEQYGLNEVEAEQKVPWWSLLLHQFRDPLIYVLLVAAAVTLVLRDFTDTGVILAVVIINAVIGYVQEHRAQQAMHALARLSAPRAEVVRGGRSQTLPSRELVPGDIVVLTSGTRIPADLRLVRSNDLEVDESTLTGESLPVRKGTDPILSETLVPGDQINMAFAGTTVTRGRGRGIVVRTGLATELGSIATAVRRSGQTATPLQETTARFGKQVGVAITGFAALVVLIGILRAMPPSEILMAAVAMAVSAVPEGLPVVLTVTLAVGVRRMAGRNAIIRSLPAVETLGSTTVIGSDKTGTLTKNEMTVTGLWAGGRSYEVTGVGYDPGGEITHNGAPMVAVNDVPLRLTLLAGVLANEADAAGLMAKTPLGDPTELALLVAAHKAGLDPGQLRIEYRELGILPFEPERRFMATLNESPTGRHIYMKGAPEAVLTRCESQHTSDGVVPLRQEDALAAAGALAASGLRVLAMAYRPSSANQLGDDLLNGGFVLAGLQGMMDPVRPEAVEAVVAAQRAGIRVLMLTGDHVDTARVIGAQLGIDPERAGALEGHHLETLSDGDLDTVLKTTNIYARVAPEHKLRIVQRLKEHGEVVAVTGDGVNDAPALRAAHIGIAMGLGGTDVARETSDMVLADDNFSTITAAVEEGRVVFSNIRKVTFFLLSTAVGEIIAIVVALLAGWPLPFVAAQILWINLVTNGMQDVALAFEPGEPGLLARPPRSPREGIVTPRLLERLGGVGLVLATGTLGVFWVNWTVSGDLDMARTAAMTQMVVFQFFHVFNCRSLDRSILTIPLLSNRFLFVSIVAAAIAHLAVLHLPVLQGIFRTVPLSVGQWVVILLVGSSVILGGELDKWWNRRRTRPIG